MIGKGDAQLCRSQSCFLIVGRVRSHHPLSIMEIAVKQNACSDSGFHTPTTAQGDAIAVGQTRCHGIAFMTRLLGLKLIDSTEGIDSYEMASLWTGREPVAHLGLQGYELGAEFVRLERVAIGIQTEGKVARHTQFHTQVGRGRSPSQGIGP